VSPPHSRASLIEPAQASASLSPGLCIIDGKYPDDCPTSGTLIVFRASREFLSPLPTHHTSTIIPWIREDANSLARFSLAPVPSHLQFDEGKDPIPG
jgi:hypothetical protein